MAALFGTYRQAFRPLSLGNLEGQITGKDLYTGLGSAVINTVLNLERRIAAVMNGCSPALQGGQGKINLSVSSCLYCIEASRS